MQIVLWALAFFRLSAVIQGDCWARSTVPLVNDFYKGGYHASPDADGCEALALQETQDEMHEKINTKSVLTSDVRSNLKQISVSNGAMGGAASQSTGSTAGSTRAASYGSIIWYATGKCSATNIRSRDGTRDNGPFGGRSGNGYCKAHVECYVRFFTPHLNC